MDTSNHVLTDSMIVEFEFDPSQIQLYTKESDPFKPCRTRVNIIQGAMPEESVKRAVDNVLKSDDEQWLAVITARLQRLQ